MRIDITSSLRHPLDDADLITRTLWSVLGRPLARITKGIGIGPRLFELAAAIFALATATFWWHGWQGAGLVTAFVALLLYIVGADELQEGTGTRFVIFLATSLCWMAWADGLGELGRGFEKTFGITLVATIIVAQLMRRTLQYYFLQRYGFDLHTWRGADRAATLFLASPAIDWAILAVCWLLAKPVTGIELVALWTLVSLLWDAVRVAMANDRRRRGKPVAKGMN